MSDREIIIISDPIEWRRFYRNFPPLAFVGYFVGGVLLSIIVFGFMMMYGMSNQTGNIVY